VESAVKTLSTKSYSMTPYAILIFMLASSFYLYEYTLQVAPSVMTHALMSEFGLDAASLSVMIAFFSIGYTPMQIPAGLLYDRFGPRILLSVTLLICSLGALLFSVTDSYVIACFSRFLIGTGAAFSFVGILVLLARWFDPHHFAMMAGIAQLMSSIGSMAGESPLAALSHNLGWRMASFALAMVGFVLAVGIWLVVRDYPPNYVERKHPEKHHNEWQRLGVVLRKGQTWAIGLYAFAVWAPIAVFGALWCVPYLERVYDISTVQASRADSLIWLGVGLGSPLFGWISDRVGLRNLPCSVSAAIGLVSSIFIVYIPISLPVMWFMLFMLGVAAAGQTVSFAMVKENHHPAHVGTASGFNNMAVVSGGLFLLPLVGYLLKANWDGTFLNGAPLYSVAAYQKSLFILPICFVLALIASIKLIRETYTRGIFE